MNIILDEPIDLEQIADLCAVGIKRKPPTQRNYQAWHVTNLLKSGQLVAKGDVRYHEFAGHPTGIMSLGRIWETAVDCYLTHYAVNLGGFYTPDVESTRDGIIASLDGVMWLPDVGWLVCETKLRFTHNGDIPLDHIQQVRAYCYLVDTVLACYVSGHISATPPAVQARMRIIQFTRQSIEETWQGIVNTKAFLERQGCHPSG